MKFNWNTFLDKNNAIAVHCKTEEEANDFCKQMDEHGMKWSSGKRYIEDSRWSTYKNEICYYNDGELSSFDYAKGYGYKILEWSDYMKKYPIDYLRYGYVVEFKNGRFAMYMPSQNGCCFDLEGEDSCIYINDFNDKENLKDISNDYNVIKIYGYSRYGSDSRKLSISNRPLIWERPEEVKKMTVSEICKELGYKVEIVEG